MLFWDRVRELHGLFCLWVVSPTMGAALLSSFNVENSQVIKILTFLMGLGFQLKTALLTGMFRFLQVQIPADADSKEDGSE